MLPSACVWLDARIRNRQSYYQKAIQFAVRSHDPFQKIVGAWLVRRLSACHRSNAVRKLMQELHFACGKCRRVAGQVSETSRSVRGIQLA
jgi:hypothetical protein